MSLPSLSHANYPPPPPIPETEHVIKPKRSVSFKDQPDDHKTQTQQSTVGLGRRPGKRAGYVRKGPVNSDSEESDQDDSEPEQEEEEDEEEDVMRSVVPRRFDDIGDSDDEHKARVADIIYPLTQTRITKTAGPGQNYVRKAPVNSDTESDEESLDPKTSKKDLQGSSQVPSRQPQIPGSPASQTSTSSSKSGGRSFGIGRGSGPGQNYVRKAPVNSDTESDEEQKDKPSFSSGTTKQNDSTPVTKPSSNNMLPIISAGRPLSLMTSSATSSPIQSRVATPPTSIHTPPQQHQQPYYQLPASAAVSAAVSAAMGQFQDPSYLTYLPQSMPMHPPSVLGSTPDSPAGLGLLGANSPAASLANSMAIYQQQQSEMMLIMQQQQIQIATMQQQQQAYQLLLLQQQQQALQQQQQQKKQVQAANRSNEDDSDDDVPLGVHQQQLPQMPQLPQLPQLGSIMGAVQAAGSSVNSSTTSSPHQQPMAAFTAPPMVHLSPHLQHSTLAPPAHPYSPLQHSPLLHSRQASSSSVHSIPYASSPLAGKSLLSSPAHNVYQHNYSNSQPRLQDFIDEERTLQEQQQQSAYPASGGLLTSSFPAGYRHSIGSVSLTQLNLNLDHGSSNSLNSLGSNGSGGGGIYGHSPNHSQTHIQVPGTNKPSRNSMMGPYPPSSSPLLGPYGMSGVPANIPLIQPHTLIHVEAKPPPPQTGLVGAISAMERDKKLAKAQGSNQQLQQQQMYLQQQQQMQMQDKERWLQEQRRMVMEGGQGQYQQPLYGVPAQGQGQRWNSDDDEDDNRPLGSH
ncbi:hypothetical protein BGZ81_009662 [Podila clonocystis]|nr:hypothetical protein BGZ81_009662 [Podila clonocystis]